MKKNILLKSFFENRGMAMTYEQAKPCYEEIVKSLSENEVVVLDFTGLNIISSPFLNGTVGLLLKDFSKEEIEKRVIIENLPIGFHDVLDTVVKNAHKFYKK